MPVLMPLLMALSLLACGDKETDDSGSHTDPHGDGGSDGGSAFDTGTLDFERTQVSSGGTYTVSWNPSTEPIVVGEDFAIGFNAIPGVMPEGGYAFTAATATMPNHGHGMNVSPVITDNGDGTATATPFQFHMEGWWEISTELTAGDGTVETATFNFYCCE